MESPAVDDDICILKHETAYGPPESPVSVCPGDESVASHFALVTAYEDIKKRLRDTEKENGLLRRRVKQLEDKHFRPEAPPSEGPQYMNKAFSAYRGIYIEKEDLQMELNKVKKEKLDSERLLTEQLQAKELELLQLRSEMETSQVMKSLTDTADYWQVDRCSSEMKIHSLQEQLERLQLENDALHKLCRAGQDVCENCVVDGDQSHEALTEVRAMGIVQSYQDVLGEVCRLQSALQSQSELLRKMRERPALPVFRRDTENVHQRQQRLQKRPEIIFMVHHHHHHHHHHPRCSVLHHVHLHAGGKLLLPVLGWNPGLFVFVFLSEILLLALFEERRILITESQTNTITQQITETQFI
uniref:5-azacytidine induced 2 n=1 Tax=Cyprinus carpio carpio TaxID=630221 RepID=A0A9J7YJW9_CYPCA